MLPDAEKLVLTILNTESVPPGSVLPIVRVEDVNELSGQDAEQPRFEKLLLLEFPERIGVASAGRTAALVANTSAHKR